MPKTSITTAPEHTDYGPAEEHTAHLDGYTVNFVTIRETHDLAPILAALPTGRCECPHWGTITTGRMTVAYADGHHETYEAGDVFYMSPGHAPAAEAGTSFVMFSPTAELEATERLIQQAMEARQAELQA